ncbi:MAG: VWA domain-containing protein [Clostridia bacterium]|nr:VWA domain-containing protein [Clostridia bacterium]
MTNFNVNFTNAWWLLLLVPAFVLTLISYFKVNKRYRATRNRIVSTVLHLVIMVLSIALLAGFTVDYYIPNKETEVILLVDTSYSQDDNKKETDTFIREVIDNCDSKYKLGIVKFGYDQVYAVKLTNKMDRVYATYQSAKNPDTTATDISAALSYASTLLSNPASARIVLISDALETDGKARDVIKSFSAKGIAVDTVYFPNTTVEREVQIVEAIPSVPKVEVNESFEMQITVESSYTGKATITPYDNNTAGLPVEIHLREGEQTVSIPYSFPWGGMHMVSFEIAAEGDTVLQNNTYHSYIYIETFSEVLVIENIKDESSSLVEMLNEELNVTVVNVADGTRMPNSLEKLRRYDEVVLVNIANADLPDGFDVMLKEYVEVIGGGLFTICGNTEDSTEDNWTANAYTRDDMYKSIYQDMLPVEIIEYTPPVGVIIIVDSSGSMLGQNFEQTRFYWALQGAKACLEGALTERDYVGIMTLADEYTEELSLTPCTQRDKFMDAITELEDQAIKGTLPSGGTLYSPALERAGKALGARSDLEKKHIIIVSDAEPSSDDEGNYKYWAAENAKLGITMSIVGIQASEEGRARMEDLLVNYAGCDKKNYHSIEDLTSLPQVMREDLQTPDIKSVNYETFVPTIKSYNSITNTLNPDEIPSLDGYYGVKLKEEATAVLMGNFTPIYAHWEYGKGRVGTFACDLNGTWSKEFITEDVGKTIINSIIYYLFPKESVRTSDIGVGLTGENYTTNLSIITELGEDEKIVIAITTPSLTLEQYTLDHKTGYSRFSFVTKESGLYTINVKKVNASDTEISSTTIYKTMSYSKEYLAFRDEVGAQELMQTLSENTNGGVIKKAKDVFDNAVKYLHIIIDPRIVFAIIIGVAFLLDIAARKFKWKWPHEIVRDKRRAREQLGEGEKGK